MKVAYQKKPTRSSSQTVPEQVAELLALDVAEIKRLIHDEVQSLGISFAQLIAAALLEREVQDLCGERRKRSKNRQAYRYGHQPGWIAVCGQKVRLSRPRVRKPDGSQEVELPSYTQLQRRENLPAAMLARMLRGVSCRDYAGVVEQTQAGFGIKHANVSRGFVHATARQVQEFVERRWDQERFVAIFIDGDNYAGETMVVALGITVKGIKRVLGLRQGATENATVCTALLADLREHGVATDEATLFVLDGGKALRAAVNGVWGRYAVVQRCQIHKKRDVRGYLPKQLWPALNRRLSEAYESMDYAHACRSLRGTASWLDGINPDAANSLREGLEETLTVVRLRMPALLRKTLSNTNAVESALSLAEKTSSRVKHWQDGDMRRRWCIAGLLDGERRFKRIRGYQYLGELLVALERSIPLEIPTSEPQSVLDQTSHVA